MANVRLSNGSPPLERMEARQADHPKPSACRCLFGPVDREQLARELEKHQRELEGAGRNKWNFDFQRHRPLEGRYEWEAVPKEALPDFYSRPPRPSPARAKAAGLDGSGPATGLRRSRGISEEDEQETGAAGAAADLVGQQSPGPRKRPASDDSSPRNKRANMTDEAISEDSSRACSVEQTPKKSSPRRHQT